MNPHQGTRDHFGPELAGNTSQISVSRKHIHHTISIVCQRGLVLDRRLRDSPRGGEVRFHRLFKLPTLIRKKHLGVVSLEEEVAISRLLAPWPLSDTLDDDVETICFFSYPSRITDGRTSTAFGCTTNRLQPHLGQVR